jgi:hypothetical protein
MKPAGSRAPQVSCNRSRPQNEKKEEQKVEEKII